MASEQELESMVVRLTGDGSSFQSMIRTATSSVAGAAEAVRAQTRLIEGFATGLRAFAATAMEALAGLGFVRWISGAQEAYEKFEQGAIRLNALIRAGGGNVDEVIPKYKAFAEAVSETTAVGKGQAFQLLTQAESMGRSGDAAERMVHNAVALAAATGETADSQMRLAFALETGNVQMIKRSLAGGRFLSDSEAMLRARKLLTAGEAAAEEQGRTASRQLERLRDSFNGMRREVGKVLVESMLPLIQVGKQAAAMANQWLTANKPLVFTIVRVGAAVASAWAAWKVLGIVLGVVNSLFTVLQLKLVVQTVAWLAWNAVVLASNFVLTTANAVIWLFNTALAVLSGTITLVTSLQFGLIVAQLGVAFLAAGIAVWGTWRALQALFGVFSTFPTATGPLAHISAMFGEWVGILKQVIKTAQTDLPGAWELLVAGFELGVSQVRDMWPPFWEFLLKGFDAVWVSVKFGFLGGMAEAMAAVNGMIAQSLGAMGLPATQAERNMVGLEKAAKHARDFAEKEGKARLAAAVAGFKVEESERTKAAEIAVTAVRLKLAFRTFFAAGDPAKKMFEDAGKGLGQAFGKGVKAGVQSAVEQVQFGSREALQRMEAFRDLRNTPPDDEQKKHTKLLGDIEKNTRGGPAGNANAPRLQPADLQED